MGSFLWEGIFFFANFRHAAFSRPIVPTPTCMCALCKYERDTLLCLAFLRFVSCCQVLGNGVSLNYHCILLSLVQRWLPPAA